MVAKSPGEGPGDVGPLHCASAPCQGRSQDPGSCGPRLHLGPVGSPVGRREVPGAAAARNKTGAPHGGAGFKSTPQPNDHRSVG
eukprot:14225214-Alexandrium_andersonii.AAC.1